MNEKELCVVKEYKFDNPIITNIDSKIGKGFRDCHKNYFDNFKYECIYHIKLTSTTNNEIINLTINGESMNLHQLNKKLSVGRQNGFIFNQINKLTKKIYSCLRYINISYYLNFPMPMGHRRFFRIISQNRDYVENFCNDMDNPFHFACQKSINQLF